MRKVIDRLSYANVVATLALFVALGGSSYAAVQLGKNSVRSKHIRNGQVKSGDLARNAVRSAKVKDGSLLAADFKAGQLPQGATGPQGAAGPQGLPGPKGDRGIPGPTASALDRRAPQANVVQIESESDLGPILTATLTTTVESRLIATATAQFRQASSSGNGILECGLVATGAGSWKGDVFDTRPTSVVDPPLTITGGTVLPAGTHTITFRCGTHYTEDRVMFERGTLTVIATAL